MSKKISLALLLGFTLLALLGANGPAPPVKPAPTAEQLVEQLGDPDFHKRNAAVAQLEALGAAALPALYKAQNHDDPEVRRRAGELIPILEAASLLAPRRVTLNAQQQPIRQVLDAIAKQTGYRIECWVGNEQQRYDFQFDNQPFWQALDHVCHAAGLVLQQGYGDNQLRLHHQDGYVPYVYYDGPVRVVANGFQHHRSIDFSFLPRTPSGSRRSESLYFSFSIFVEPRLPLLGMGETRLTAAYDSENHSMLPHPTGSSADPEPFGRRWTSRYGSGYRSYSHQTQVALLPPAEKAQSVKLIQGSVPILLLANQKPEVITDKVLESKGKRVKVGATSFVIEDVTATANKQYQIKMTITEEGKDNPNDYTWINSLYQRIELHDEEGNKYQMYGNSWGSSGPNHANVTFTYASRGNAKLGPPSKLIYYLWSTVQHQVRFEFRNLPLP
jgi:hypothetical protein